MALDGESIDNGSYRVEPSDDEKSEMVVPCMVDDEPRHDVTQDPGKATKRITEPFDGPESNPIQSKPERIISTSQMARRISDEANQKPRNVGSRATNQG